MQINSAKELNVYKKAYSLAMNIFEVSKAFPKEGGQRTEVRGRRSEGRDRKVKVRLKK